MMGSAAAAAAAAFCGRDRAVGACSSVAAAEAAEAERGPRRDWRRRRRHRRRWRALSTGARGAVYLDIEAALAFYLDVLLPSSSPSSSSPARSSSASSSSTSRRSTWWRRCFGSSKDAGAAATEGGASSAPPPQQQRSGGSNGGGSLPGSPTYKVLRPLDNLSSACETVTRGFNEMVDESLVWVENKCGGDSDGGEGCHRHACARPFQVVLWHTHLRGTIRTASPSEELSRLVANVTCTFASTRGSKSDVRSVGIVHGRLRPSHVLSVERCTQWVSVSAPFNRQPRPTAQTRMVEPFSSADCTPATHAPAVGN